MGEDKLDPRLRFLQEEARAGSAELAESMRLEAVARVDHQVGVEVLLRCHKASGTKTRRSVESRLRGLGVTVRTVVDGPAFIVSGSVALDQLGMLLAEDWIESIEASKQLFPDLDLSGADVGVRPVQTLPPSRRGDGVLVGVIDGGIDFTHDDFRLPDGRSRIRFLWDQGTAAVPGGRVPFGREYTQADLNATLSGTATAAAVVTHNDPEGHGTHVAGIAAGNGRQSGGQFLGMAPDAELVVVALRSDAGTLGESGSAVVACQYIVDRARELGRPVAINMSQGNNGGGHCGETPLEGAMDNLAREPGVVLVKSAGNEQSWRIHASGTLSQGQTARRQFDSSGNNTQQDVLEVWFDAADHIGIAVQAPGAPLPAANDFVLPQNSNTFQTPAGNIVRIDARGVNASATGDVRAMVFIGRGAAPRIQPGRWALHFRGDQITHGEFHAWIERTARQPGGVEQSRFTAADHDPACTISIPGTARRIITVGAYVTRFSDDAALGALSSFSSRGASRYGLRKPELAAPGEAIASALSSASGGAAFAPGYTLMSGTSMAAPHVAGAAALLLEVNPQLSCEQVKQVLARAASRKGAAASAPDDAWGSGRLDVQRAVELAQSARFPVVSKVTVAGTQLSWDTDLPTTGAVRFNTHPKRLALGRDQGSRTSLTPGQHHVVDLQGLPPGTYYCEVLAFSEDPEEWLTVEDDQGQHFTVMVP